MSRIDAYAATVYEINKRTLEPLLGDMLSGLDREDRESEICRDEGPAV